MPDEVTTTKKSAPVTPTSDPASDPAADKFAPEVVIPVDTAVEDTDHNANINKALDAARDAMIASGMPVGDANAFLSAARPSGVSTVVGGFHDLNLMTGLPVVVNPVIPESRLQFAHKIDKDVEVPEPTEERARELKASAAVAAAQEKKDGK